MIKLKNYIINAKDPLSAYCKLLEKKVFVVNTEEKIYSIATVNVDKIIKIEENKFRMSGKGNIELKSNILWNGHYPKNWFPCHWIYILSKKEEKIIKVLYGT